MSFRAALAGAAVLLAASSLACAGAAPAGAVPPVAAPAAPAAAAAAAASARPAPDTAAENAPAAAQDDTDLPMPPVPPRIAEGADYEKCLDMLATDPSGADSMAAGMAEGGGGEAAQHCHALAQVELGNTEAGAALLDRLAATSHAPAVSRAVVFGQADQAWTMAGRADQAFASASQALALSPDDPELLIGHAIAALALRRFADASDDLTRALEIDPKRADALVLRATAARQLGRLDLARADMDAAFALDPDNADALLERGIIRQRQGDLAGARADWERAAELGADTSTGDLAQQNLALLAAGPRQ
jgi:Flp pilus assembly protein TadD